MDYFIKWKIILNSILSDIYFRVEGMISSFRAFYRLNDDE